MVALVLFLLPFAQEFSLTGVFSFKAKVAEVKQEVSDFKSETRNYINQQNALISTITSIQNSNNVHVYVPGHTDASNAAQKILEKRPQARQNYKSDSEEILIMYQNMDHVELATTMAGLRIKLETALRAQFGHSTKLLPKNDRRYFSLGGLWRKYLKENPDKHFLDSAMRFVMDVGNAGAHGQAVPPDTAVEANFLADSILSELRDNG